MITRTDPMIPFSIIRHGFTVSAGITAEGITLAIDACCQSVGSIIAELITTLGTLSVIFPADAADITIIKCQYQGHRHRTVLR